MLPISNKKLNIFRLIKYSSSSPSPLNSHHFIRKSDIFDHQFYFENSKIINYASAVHGLVIIHVSCKKITLQADQELIKPIATHKTQLKSTEMVSHYRYTHDKTASSLEEKTNQYTHQSPDTHRSIHAFTHPDTRYLRLCKPSTH